MSDRRKQPRKKIDIILNAYQDGLPTLVRGDDVSISGMRLSRILGPRRSRPERIDIEFRLPNDPEILYVRGQPVYQRGEGQVVGIAFLGMTDHQRRKVGAFVEGTPHMSSLFRD